MYKSVDNVSGPFTTKNLTVFFIHGKERENTTNFLSLEEALERGKIEVAETGIVNELNINSDCEEHIFIQAGDIVKGGKQDRTIKDDTIVEPKSRSVKVKSFCVERGRWNKRGAEDDSHFSHSDYHGHKSFKMASRHSASQHEVWSEVDNIQRKYASSGNVPLSEVQGESPTSLHLTHENFNIKNAANDYLEELEGLLETNKNALGFAFAINGEMTGMDIYPTSALFKKMWSKLIRSAVLEAYSEVSPDKKSFSQPTSSEVKDFYSKAQAAQAKDSIISGRCKTIMKEDSDYILFEACDTNSNDIWMHQNFIAK